MMGYVSSSKLSRFISLFGSIFPYLFVVLLKNRSPCFTESTTTGFQVTDMKPLPTHPMLSTLPIIFLEKLSISVILSLSAFEDQRARMEF